MKHVRKKYWNTEFLYELYRVSGVHPNTIKHLVVLIASHLGLLDEISYYPGKKYKGHLNSYNPRYYVKKRRGDYYG